MHGVEPHEPNINNVGRSRVFYGDPRESELEKKTADLEGQFGSLISNLRATRSLSPTQVPLMLQFVAHLMIRTRNLRDGTAAIGPVMLDGMEQYFSNPENQAALLAHMRPGIQQKISDDPSVHSVATALVVPKQVLLELAMSQLNSAPMDEFISVVMQQMRSAADFPAIARDVHLNAMQSEESVKSRTENLKILSWSVCEYEPRALILGDAVVLARRIDGPFDLALLVQPEFHEVAVPIAHDLLLFGSGSAISPVQPSLDVINETSAAVSRDWFVAAKKSSVEECLHRHTLGTRCAFLSESDAQNLIGETRDSLANSLNGKSPDLLNKE